MLSPASADRHVLWKAGLEQEVRVSIPISVLHQPHQPRQRYGPVPNGRHSRVALWCGVEKRTDAGACARLEASQRRGIYQLSR